jgi:hypothetical protein
MMSILAWVWRSGRETLTCLTRLTVAVIFACCDFASAEAARCLTTSAVIPTAITMSMIAATTVLVFVIGFSCFDG